MSHYLDTFWEVYQKIKVPWNWFHSNNKPENNKPENNKPENNKPENNKPENQKYEH